VDGYREYKMVGFSKTKEQTESETNKRWRRILHYNIEVKE